MTYSSPLRWPSDVPRHKGARSPGQFQIGGERAMLDLDAELRRFGAASIVITASIGVGQRSGRFYTDDLVGRIQEPGVALFMRRKGRDLVFALDRYSTVLANLRALTLSIEAIRTIERYGGGALEDRALAGFAALPPSTSIVRAWWVVLELAPDIRTRLTREQALDAIETQYRALARARHPDVGGSTEAMVELNRARDEARKELAS